MSFFSHEQVQQNLQDIFSTYQEVAIQTGRLGFMSKAQKIEHIGAVSYTHLTLPTIYSV